MKDHIWKIAGIAVIAAALAVSPAVGERADTSASAKKTAKKALKIAKKNKKALKKLPAGPEGPQGPAGPQGAQGDPGLLDEITVVTNTTGFSSSDNQSITAACPDGKQVISGGTLIDGDFLNIAIDASSALNATTWGGSAHEETATADGWAVTVYAYCADVQLTGAVPDVIARSSDFRR